MAIVGFQAVLAVIQVLCLVVFVKLYEDDMWRYSTLDQSLPSALVVILIMAFCVVPVMQISILVYAIYRGVTRHWSAIIGVVPLFILSAFLFIFTLVRYMFAGE